MGRKKDEQQNPESCLSKANDDEPIFVLRGQDALSPIMVEAWILFARANGVAEDKLAEAEACARAMRMWRPQRMPT